MHRQQILGLIDNFKNSDWISDQEKSQVEDLRDFVSKEELCFHRSLEHGHITGSSFILSPDGKKTLLTHHRKLGMWIQLGGHADGDPDIFAVALREAQEESGLDDFNWEEKEIFDLDIHPIPARKSEPEHLHYDVRFLLRARSEQFQVSEESLDLKWIPLTDVANFTDNKTVQRMAKKVLSSH